MSELIDRQEVIERLKKAEDVFRQNGAKLEANGIHYALELVESDIEIPTVDAYPFEQLQELVKLNQQFAQEIAELKRPQGKWIITSEDADGIHHIKCPFCKYEKGHEFEPHIKITFDKLPYFCEYCGADMREEADNEITN